MLKTASVMLLSLALVVQTAHGAAKTGLSEGTPDIKSAGPLTFGPDGVLFVADTQSAAIFAIDTGDAKGNPSAVQLNVENLDGQVAGLLGTTSKDIQINDLAVNPASGNAYLSVSRGRGPDAQPVLLRVGADGKIAEVSLKKVKFSKAELPNAPAPGGEGNKNKRSQSITDLAYVDGRVFIAGLSNEEFESTLRSVPYPFSEVNQGTGVKVFHGSHGRFETEAPVRTFAPFVIDRKPYLLAAYTCTPLVKFPISDLKPGVKLQGTTIAELGNRNRPLDMFVYKKDGKNFVLLANSARGVMKISTDNIDKIDGITNPVKGNKTAGLPYETIGDLKGVEQLDRLNADNAVVIVRSESGTTSLQTIALP